LPLKGAISARTRASSEETDACANVALVSSKLKTSATEKRNMILILAIYQKPLKLATPERPSS
jgi:hypothetical protein